MATLLQRSTTDVYDADSNLISETDPLGRTTTYGYDKDNRQTSVVDPLKPYDDHGLRRLGQS